MTIYVVQEERKMGFLHFASDNRETYIFSNITGVMEAKGTLKLGYLLSTNIPISNKV